MKQKYKVFLNDRLIQIISTGEITINKPTVFFEKEAGISDVHFWFNSFKNSNLKKIFLVHPNPSVFFTTFKNAFRQIEAAGGVVISGDELLFIYRRGKWDLPKGKIDKDETHEDAALREVAEECGISGQKIAKKLPSTFHIYKFPFADNKEEWIFKQTYWFEMHYSGSLAGRPQIEEDITAVKWLSRFQLDEVVSNTYENLKQIIEIYRP